MNNYDPPPPRKLRYCPACHCWGLHRPGCPEDDEETDRLADEAYTLEEMKTINDEGD